MSAADDTSQRSRSRGSYRYTLTTDVVEWARAEAARRQVSASDVVQDALEEARSRAERGTGLFGDNCK